MLLAEGRRLLDAGLIRDATELLGRARSARPDALSAQWLSEAQLLAGALDDASATIAEGRLHAPSHPALVVLDAETWLRRGALEAAEAILDAAIASGPPSPAVISRRGQVHALAGEFDAARQQLEQAIELDPSDLAARSWLIVAASRDPALTTEALKRLQRAVAPAAVPPPRFAVQPIARRPLRVGYVCSGFHQHAAASVAAATLLRHDPARVQVHCYAAGRRRDFASVRFRMAATGWRGIAGMTDTAAAQAIRDDRIDILVDLDGHFAHNRLGVFVQRAAPVQISAWGYVAGAGWPGVDYLLTDEVVVPPGERDSFTERLIDLPCAQPYDPALTPRVPPAGPRHAGPIRFGCFNRYDKLSDGALSLWGRILSGCPGSTLTLKHRFALEPRSQARVRAAVAREGADPRRVVFEMRESPDAYLAAFDRIDVALDPFPVSGGVTTLDGLSRGVPAITLGGAAPTARITASILSYLGLERCIASTPDDYVRLAVSLARDPGNLTALRRDVLAAWSRFSPAAMQSYAGAVEDIYDEIWARYLAETPAT